MKGRVLVIDDEPFIGQLVKARLESNDYEVLLALKGSEGIEIAKREKPDVILLDIAMPEMDGFEAGAILQGDNETKDIPIIMLTAEGSKEAIIKAIREAGARDYIIKPFVPEQLLARIDNILK